MGRKAREKMEGRGKGDEGEKVVKGDEKKIRQEEGGREMRGKGG